MSLKNPCITMHNACTLLLQATDENSCSSLRMRFNQLFFSYVCIRSPYIIKYLSPWDIRSLWVRPKLWRSCLVKQRIVRPTQPISTVGLTSVLGKLFFEYHQHNDAKMMIVKPFQTAELGCSLTMTALLGCGITQKRGWRFLHMRTCAGIVVVGRGFANRSIYF